MKERTFDATTANLSEVFLFIDEWLESLDCGLKAQTQLDLAVDELFTNIASYAYAPGSGQATIRLDFDDVSRMASITFIDSGVPYDPVKKPDPDVTLSVEEREIGGLGIYMAKKSTDRMEYRRENDRNILTIYKRI